MMMANGWTVVLDVGKTLAKATLWDEQGSCIAHRSRPNKQPNMGGGLTLDVAGIERWLEATLKEFATLGPVAAIIPVAHGAGAAIIRNNRLQCAPIDYEWRGAALDRATYDNQRDPFSATGSPALPAGLNLGVQLHWLESLRSGDFRSGSIIPWAQYWAWLLCGVAASEVTSLGCHTDLWRPFERRASDRAVQRGWAERLAPVKPAGAILGGLAPDWVKRTGLPERVEVYCGLHDSNAALLAARSHPELQGRDATVLSTGTWFIAMRTPATGTPDIPELPETRDCLVNVDVNGAPVPSSRFMGGRELEMLIGAEPSYIDAQLAEKIQLNQAIDAVEHGKMILPSPVRGVGPFPKAPHRAMERSGESALTSIAHLYAALVADVSLDLIGSRDNLLIDGRFSQAPVFVQALARLRPKTTVFISDDENGVAHGALQLVTGTDGKPAALERISPLPVEMDNYRARWREAAERRE
jgi:sugar (pentulose or hexulose) kinase